MDYSALLYDPVYAAIGVPATLSVGTAGTPSASLPLCLNTASLPPAVEITVIDDTRPAKASSSTMGMRSVSTSQLETRSVGPGAFARIPELTANGITTEDCIGSVLTFNGRSWAVRNKDLIGSPNGEDLGQVRFFLKAMEP